MNLKKMAKLHLIFLFVFMVALMGYFGPVSECDAANGAEGMVRNMMAYPSMYAVMLEISAPARVNLNEPFNLEVAVRNLISSKVESVVVTGKLPKELKLNSSTPTAKPLEGGELQWTLGTINPRESKVIQLNGSASAVVGLTPCFMVTYKLPLCVTINVVKPALSLVKTAPSKVILCDPIPLRFVVTNTGVGMATNVVVSDPLPQGWATMDGKTMLTFNAGSLPEGQSREFTVVAKASKTGRYVNKATAVADGGLTADSSTVTVVTLPVLVLTKTGPKKASHGRRITYNILLSNNGDADARDTILEDLLPSNTTFISATGGGIFSDLEGKVVWNLGTLKPKDSVKTSVIVRADQYGISRNNVIATAYCAKAKATTQTRVLGIPAILLEVIDIKDPIPLGKNVAYDITVTNQGTDPNTNIKIVVGLEPSVRYVSASGPTKGTLADGTLTFAPVIRLNPKNKVTWRVIVEARAVADSRFKVTLTSNELERPVEETESTHLYEGE